MNGFADFVIAAKAERYVGDAAAHLRMRQGGLDPTRSVDVVDRVVVVLLHSGGNGEDIGIEDDVFRRKADFVDENPVGALADADLSFVSRRLTLFIEGHHDYGSPVLQNFRRILTKLLFAFLE